VSFIHHPNDSGTETIVLRGCCLHTNALARPSVTRPSSQVCMEGSVTRAAKHNGPWMTDPWRAAAALQRHISTFAHVLWFYRLLLRGFRPADLSDLTKLTCVNQCQLQPRRCTTAHKQRGGRASTATTWPSR
jgi:hypothetical protein